MPMSFSVWNTCINNILFCPSKVTHHFLRSLTSSLQCQPPPNLGGRQGECREGLPLFLLPPLQFRGGSCTGGRDNSGTPLYIGGAGGVVVQSTLPPTSNRDEDSDAGGCTSRCCSTVSVSRPRLPRGPQQQQLTSHSTLLYSVDLLFTTLPANSSLHNSSLISFRPVHFLPDTARGTTIVRGSLNLLRDFHQRLGNLHFPYG